MKRPGALQRQHHWPDMPVSMDSPIYKELSTGVYFLVGFRMQPLKLVALKRRITYHNSNLTP